MIFRLILVTSIFCAGGLQVAVAGDAAAGASAYASKACIGCHGPDGKSANEAIYPSLAGQDAATISAALKAFRGGERSNPLMSPMAASLTDDDIGNLAAYLSGL